MKDEDILGSSKMHVVVSETVIKNSAVWLMFKGKTTLSLQCLYQMSPLNHKRTASSLVQPRFYIAKKSAIKDLMSQLPSKHKIYVHVLSDLCCCNQLLYVTSLLGSNAERKNKIFCKLIFIEF